jgi:MOSC domain-containing protein YiiM
MSCKVVAVHSKSSHNFSKTSQASIELIEGHGVRDDAHFGVTVKHRSRVAKDPSQPNLRQVHLMHQELFDELVTKGFEVLPGQMGENVTTQGIPLLELMTGTRLRLGETAIVEITGLRNPCSQIEAFKKGLLDLVLTKTKDGVLIRKAGIMGIVLVGGVVKPEDEILIVHQPSVFNVLKPV